MASLEEIKSGIKDMSRDFSQQFEGLKRNGEDLKREGERMVNEANKALASLQTTERNLLQKLENVESEYKK